MRARILAIVTGAFLSAGFVLAGGSAGAAPDLRHVIEAGPLQVYRDHEHREVFYYAPGDLRIAQDRGGRPDLRFLQMRYVGTALYGDEGETGSFSTLTMRFRMHGLSVGELSAVRRGIQKVLKRTRIELRPLPITRFEASLVYASIAAPEESHTLPQGFFESDGERGAHSTRDGFWTERTYTVPMDRHTSQLFWHALQEGQLVMSLAYVFYTEGRGHDGEAIVSLRKNSSDAMQDLLERLGLAEPDALDRLAEELAQEAEETLSSKMIRSGALAVRVDAKRWPDLFQRIDFNDRMPPGYAGLKIYCYDFQNGLRSDLFYKKVEIVAQAVGGKEVRLETKFLSSQPDLYARSVRFPIAVYLDRPYRYRIVAAHRDGTIREGSWQERESWSRILDVTSRPEDALPGGEG